MCLEKSYFRWILPQNSQTDETRLPKITVSFRLNRNVGQPHFLEKRQIFVSLLSLRPVYFFITHCIIREDYARNFNILTLRIGERPVLSRFFTATAFACIIRRGSGLYLAENGDAGFTQDIARVFKYSNTYFSVFFKGRRLISNIVSFSGTCRCVYTLWRIQRFAVRRETSIYPIGYYRLY
jgi:hypothetical protein